MYHKETGQMSGRDGFPNIPDRTGRMPELPEVELFRQDIGPFFSGAPISSVRIFRRDLFVSGRDLPSGSWTGGPVSRHGKILLLSFLPTEGGNVGPVSGDPWVLLSRFGMSGSWRIQDKKGRTPVHTHLEIRFSDRPDRLLWVDPRRFGRLEWTQELSRSKLLEEVGPDALGISVEKFAERLSGSGRPIRSALLDQKRISGIGNIYAAEILFRSGINPFRMAGKLTLREFSGMCQIMQQIFGEAVNAGGSTIHSYTRGNGSSGGFQHQHLVYGREGLPCVRCGVPIQRVAMENRSLYYCSFCQGSS